MVRRSLYGIDDEIYERADFLSAFLVATATTIVIFVETCFEVVIGCSPYHKRAANFSLKHETRQRQKSIELHHK